MTRIHIDTCPLCGYQTSEQALMCVDRYASGETFHVARCASCGFLFTQDFPAESEIGVYYETPDYISHTDTKRGLMNTLYHYVRNYMLRRKARLVEQALGVKRGRLLDIGTGTGYFPAVMQRRGWAVQAIEKSEQARGFARDHFGLQVHPDEALMEGLTGERFDVITLWHVMEHLEHLDEVWQRLNALLTDNGVLIVAVPNAASWDAKHYGADWAAYDVPRHLWHFTPVSMLQWGMKHGFVPVKRLPMPFDAFYVSMLTEQHLKHRFSFLRGLVTGTLAWLATWGGKDRSSSMIYLFRKEEKGRE
ncbi:MAG: class I SAM-dependent methyltransferase [Bacteroides sp.]|nr:class I SAM-dependent methyltransferase [Bacteroides sp.]